MVISGRPGKGDRRWEGEGAGTIWPLARKSLGLRVCNPVEVEVIQILDGFIATIALLKQLAVQRNKSNCFITGQPLA